MSNNPNSQEQKKAHSNTVSNESNKFVTGSSFLDRTSVLVSQEDHESYRSIEFQRQLKFNNITRCYWGIAIFLLFLLSAFAYFATRLLFSFHDLSKFEFFLGMLLLIIEILMVIATFPICFSRVFKWQDFELESLNTGGFSESVTVLVYGFEVKETVLERCVDSLLVAQLEYNKPVQIILYDYIDETILKVAAKFREQGVVAVRQRQKSDNPKLTKPELINFVLDAVYPHLDGLENELVCLLDGNQIVKPQIFSDADKYFNFDRHLVLLQYATCESEEPTPAADVFALCRPIENNFNSRLIAAVQIQTAFETNLFFKVSFLIRHLTGVLESCEGAWGSLLARKLYTMQAKCLFVHYHMSSMCAKESLQTSYRRINQDYYARLQLGFDDRSGIDSEQLLFGQANVYRFEWIHPTIFSFVQAFLIILSPVATIFGAFPIRCENMGYLYVISTFLIFYSLIFVLTMAHRDFFGLWNQAMSDKFLWWVRLRAFFRFFIVQQPLNTFTKKQQLQQVDEVGLSLTPFSITQDLIMHVCVFVLNLMSACIGVWLLLRLGNIDSYVLTQNIPLLLMCLLGFYNALIHSMPLFAANVSLSAGRSIVVEVQCIFTLALVFGTCLAICIITWQHEPIDFDKVINFALEFFQIQKSGSLQGGQFQVSWRGDAHISDGLILDDEREVNLSGGYYHGAGQVKFTLPIAYSMSVLALAFKLYPSQIAQVTKEKYFDAIKWGGDYLWKTVIETSDLEVPLQVVVQVGDLQRDINEWTRAEQSFRIPRPVLTASQNQPAAEVYAMLTAGLAGCAFAVQYWDQGYVQPYMQKALAVYLSAWNQSSYRLKFDQLQYAYPSKSYFDELMYAASWLSLINPDSFEYPRDFFDALALVPSTQRTSPIAGLTNVYMLAMTVMGINPGYDREREIVKGLIDNWIEAKPPLVEASDGLVGVRNGRRNVPNLMDVAFMAAAIGSTDEDKEQSKYLCWAFEQLRYILGDNSLGMSFVVGYGNKYPQFVRHKAASCPATIATPCGKKFLVSRQPNPSIAYGGVVNGPNLQGKFNDDRTNMQNEPFIENSATIVGLAAMVKQVDILKLCYKSGSLLTL